MSVNPYARTYRVNSVLTASPGQLVLMLFDGTLKALGLATQAMAEMAENPRRIPDVHKELMRAQGIIAELQSGLNLENGGDFAQTMHGLYDYYNRRLFEANLRKQVEPVLEVERLIRELRDAWAEMLKQQPEAVAAERFCGAA
jgi:flagellar protein FliS